jgi:hypothetical protein
VLLLVAGTTPEPYRLHTAQSYHVHLDCHVGSEMSYLESAICRCRLLLHCATGLY